MAISQSATKLSLLAIVSCVIITTLAIVIYNVTNGDVVKTVLSVFNSSVMLVLWFYFWQKVSLSK